MFLRLRPKLGLLLLLLSACAFFVCEARSQVKFIQITDPHIYDDKPENIANDNQAFLASIKEINRQIEKGKSYDFVVVTGDLGIEALFKKTPADALKFEDRETRENLRKQAAEFSKVIGLSNVARWIFVAGNNDLLNEQPETIIYFDYFIEELKNKLQNKEIVNLTAANLANTFSVNGLSFIGFNSASFKNQYEADRLLNCGGNTAGNGKAISIHDTQFGAVDSIFKTVNEAGNAKIFIFYHIPEIDDRHLLDVSDDDEDLQIKKKNKSCTGEENIYSPWFVTKDIRDKWNEIVKKENVKGLFAGHFHDNRRDTYQQVRWLRSAAYPSASLSKLYVCPPLAKKFQNDKPETARGFQEVSIDADGNVLDYGGKNGVKIFWYDEASNTFKSDVDSAKESEALEQLKLGELYESSERLKDAEAAYIKALASDDSINVQKAREGLNRVIEKQASPWSRYVFSEGTIRQESLFLLISLIVLLLLLLWFGSDTKSYKNQHKVLPVITVTILLVGVFLLIWLALLLVGDYLFKTWGAPIPPSLALLWTLAVAALGFLLAREIMRLRGRDKLLIDPITDTTEHKLGATFPQIFSIINDDIVYVRNFKMMTPQLHIVTGEDTELIDLADESIGGIYGKIIGWFLRKSTRPEYVLKCTLQSENTNLTFTAKLEKRGTVLNTWYATFAADNLFDNERQLAHDILTYLDDIMD